MMKTFKGIFFIIISCLFIESSINANPSYQSVLFKDGNVDSLLAENNIFKHQSNSDTIQVEANIPQLQILYSHENRLLEFSKDILLPVLMLILGVAIDRIIMWFDKREKLKREWLKWKMELSSTKTSILMQQEEIKRFINENHERPNSFFDIDFTLYIGIDASNFEMLRKEDFEEYYANKQSAEKAHKATQKIVGTLSLIKVIYQKLSLKYNDYVQSVKNEITEYNRELEQYENEFYSLCKTNIFKNDEKKYLVNLHNNEVKMKSPYLNPFELSDSFVNPTSLILSRYAPNTNIAVNLLQNLSNKEVALRLEKKYIEDNLIEFNKQYTNIIVSLEQIYQDMGKLEKGRFTFKNKMNVS